MSIELMIAILNGIIAIITALIGISPGIPGLPGLPESVAPIIFKVVSYISLSLLTISVFLVFGSAYLWIFLQFFFLVGICGLFLGTYGNRSCNWQVSLVGWISFFGTLILTFNLFIFQLTIIDTASRLPKIYSTAPFNVAMLLFLMLTFLLTRWSLNSSN